MNLPQLTPRQKTIARWVGYPLLALFTFIITLHLTFPYERAKGWLEEQASDKYDVKIKEISPNILPGGVTLTGVKIRPRPKKADDTPPAITIDELEADVSLFGLLRGRLDVDIEATLGKGSVSGAISSSKAGLDIDLSTKKLPLQHVPGVKEAVGLPMEGGLNLELAIWLPRNRWREADGKIKLSCPSCTVGDGVAKIKPKPREGATGSRASAREQFIGEGIEVPRLDLGNLAGQIDIKSGKGVITNFRGESVDGEMLIEGDIEFKDPFKMSSFPGCMKFKFTPDFHTREPKFANVPNLMGAGIQPDGFAHVRLSGTLGDLKWKPRLKCSDGGTGPEGEGNDRPVVTTRPDRPEPTVTPPVAGEQPPQPGQPGPAIPVQPPPDAAVPDQPPNGERPRGIDDVKPMPPEDPPEHPEGEHGGRDQPGQPPQSAPTGEPLDHDPDAGQ
jgi:type II secretion system protein N